MRSIFGVLALFHIVVLAIPAAAQIRIRGQVLDDKTGDPLPYATVRIPLINRGAVSNVSGQFVLTIPGYPTALEARYIGYMTGEIVITSANAANVVIRLAPSSVQLDELFVTDDNPAERIIRQAIEAKARMRKHLHSAYADAYTRFMLYAEFDLVQMNESVRAWWWTPSSGPRELIRADRSQPAQSGVFRFAKPHNVVNFYDDEIEILGTTYAGPLHPDATDLYVFRLGGIRTRDDQRVYDIYFTPRSPTRPAFVGHMAVLDSTFAMLGIGARPHPNTIVTPPVEKHDVYMEQHFFAVGDSVWLPADLYARGTVAFGRVGVSYPMARYEQVSGMSLHAVNPPVPDSMSVPGPAQIRHPFAHVSDELFFRNPSYIPMTPREVEQMVTMDPRMTLDRGFRAEGMLAAYVAFPIMEEEESEERDFRLELADRILGGDWFWYNRVDGWHPGLGYGRDHDNGVSWRTSVGYSIERERPSHRSRVSVPWKAGLLQGSVGVSALDATAVVARPDGLGRFVPGISTYLGNDDLYDYFAHRRGTLEFDVSTESSPVVISLRVNTEIHKSVKKLSDFNGWLFRNVQRENPKIISGDLRSFELGTQIGTGKPLSLEVTYERAPGKVWHSDFSFRRYEARGSLRLKTFYSWLPSPQDILWAA